MITGLTVKANALACVSLTLSRLTPETPARIEQMRFQYLAVDKNGVSAVGELVVPPHTPDVAQKKVEELLGMLEAYAAGLVATGDGVVVRAEPVQGGIFGP